MGMDIDWNMGMGTAIVMGVDTGMNMAVGMDMDMGMDGRTPFFSVQQV